LLSGDFGSLLRFAGVLDLLLLGVVFLEELLVVDSLLLGVLDVIDHGAAGDLLSAELGLGDHALHLGGLVEGLVTVLTEDGLTLLGGLLVGSANDVLGDIVLLVESVELDDSVSPLLSETVSMVGSGDDDGLVGLLAFELELSLDDNAEGDDGKIGSGDASTDGLSLALTRAAGLEGSATLFEVMDAGSSLDENTLLHGESLFVVSSGDSEDVSLELFAHNLAVNLLAHALVKERTNVLLVFNLDNAVTASSGV